MPEEAKAEKSPERKCCSRGKDEMREKDHQGRYHERWRSRSRAAGTYFIMRYTPASARMFSNFALADSFFSGLLSYANGKFDVESGLSS